MNGDEQRILEEVRGRLADAREVDASDVEVTVRDGEVRLEGSVLDDGMRRRAGEIAEAVGGVRRVRNEVLVRPQGTAALSAGYGTPVAGAFGLDAQAPAPAPDRDTVPDGDPAPAPPVAPARSAAEAPRTVAALFDDPDAAERAVQQLEADGHARVTVAGPRGQGAAGAGGAEGGGDGALGALKSLFAPEAEDRGGTVVAAVVTERRAEATTDLLRRAGAVELDAREGGWRATGWREYEPLPSGTPDRPV